jgi:polyphosphate glucokinase
MKILAVDVGGTNVKLLASGHRALIRIKSGPTLTPREMVRAVRAATTDWKYDRVSIGYPGPVRDGKPVEDPWNLGPGWVGFDFARAFGKPVRLVNDAAMQALGSYEGGGTMLFLGLGTGLGTALIQDGALIPLELAHLPYHGAKTYEDCIGEAGFRRLGKRRWRQHVLEIVELLSAAFLADYVVLGGGNVRHMKRLPRGAKRGKNANAFLGGFRLWKSTRAS